MLGMPEPTPYDLRFRFLGVPVRVHPWFWIVTAMLGANNEADLPTIAIWVACVFVSILVHEYGHALMSRAFRCSPAIVLYGMGGLCYSEAERQSPWQRIAVLLCGPGAGFLLLGLIFGGWFVAGRPLSNHLVGEILKDMLWINLIWGLVNLLPIWPLDGGQISGVVLSMINRRRGMTWAYVVSLLTAGTLAVLAFQYHLFFEGIFFAYFGVNNYQMLQQIHHATKYGDLEEDADWWKR